MLDADEAAGFDEAMRDDPELRIAYRDMNGLGAAIAAATVTPITPRAGQLERLQFRLGLHVWRHPNWLGITGWAAAAALTVILVLDHRQTHRTESAAFTPSAPIGKSPFQTRGNDSTTRISNDKRNDSIKEPDVSESEPNAGLITTQQSQITTIAKAETQRLNEEIETLHGMLDEAQKLNQKRFETVSGMAWPIIMTMSPPGNARATTSLNTLAENSPPLTSIIGDALAGAAATPAADPVSRVGDSTAAQGVPSAIPIYDAARRAGTLVVLNLPPTNPDERYNLWVKTKNGENPTLVGQLPTSNTVGSEPYDFSLGTSAIIPTGFILTKDPIDKPINPTSANTILSGPH